MNNMVQEQTFPNLDSLVHIRQHGLRSIQVENDLGNQGITENYVLTAQSRTSLSRVLQNLNEKNHARSWTLTGPYGSGKSYFSLFLMNLACVQQPAHSFTISQLQSVDPVLTQQAEIAFHLNESRGLLPIAITGFRASFIDCLKHGFLRAIDKLEKSQALIDLRQELEGWTARTESRSVIRWIQNLVSTVTSSDYCYHGVLLVFDEMGKPLEFASTHSEDVDVYLLQELAEYANRSGNTPFLFVGILHQGFERYAATLDQATQREWNKVQGRFEDIAFQEPPNQQTRLLAKTIEPIDLDQIREKVPSLAETAQNAISAGWCPALMKEEEFLEICKSAYPFHASTLVALPYLFKRLAQNERSIFAYLACYEPFGFHEFLRSHSSPAFLRLPDLFDYLVANFQAKLYASNRARALTETLERLNTATGLNSLEIAIVKSIGLLNWLSEVSSLQANEALLSNALVSEENSYQEIRKATAELKKRSIIVFRKHSRTYAIWQGSDVDIEERMAVAQQQVGGSFGLAEAVQRYLPPRPLIARRHSYQTGTLRFFEVRYIDFAMRDQISLDLKTGASGLVILCLAASQPEVEGFTAWAEQPEIRAAEGVLIGITKRTARLGELLYDLRCYHWVEENTPELRDDPVARKELFIRINAIETIIQGELDNSVSLHRLTDSSGCLWKFKGADLSINSDEGISQVLSKICDDLYPSSPKIWNELINRRNLSSQSAAARRNLIEAMLTRINQPQMGIEGYPPERSMYESLLLGGGLHQEVENGKWQITEPSTSDPLNLLPAWEAIKSFVFTFPPEPRPVVKLFQQLMAPPYGITEGVLPVILCAFLQVYADETTMYREGTLLVEPNVPDWEVMLRRPELFAVAGCQVTGNQAAVIARIARGLNTPPTVMAVVRSLVRQIRSLPEYAWKTQHLSKEAIGLRKAIETAHSPEKLLFLDLPQALLLEPIAGDRLDEQALEKFFNRLNLILSELATATPKRREWARDTLLEACALPTGIEGWQMFIDIAREMNGKIHHPTLAPLVKRTAEAADAATALDSALGLLANRPMRAWTDVDVNRFPAQASSLGQIFVSERNGFLPGVTLTHEEKQRSEKITSLLQEQLQQYDEDPKILLAALQSLLDHFKSENPSYNN